MPLINFLNFYFFGQTKFGTNNYDLFSQTQWGENIAWRGFFPSAETIGEFFAIAIFLYFIAQLKNGFKFSAKYLFLIFPVLGLYLSNNKAATFLLMVSLFLVLRNSYSSKKYECLFTFFSLCFCLSIRFENLYFLSISHQKKSWRCLQFKVLNMIGQLCI